MSGEKEQDSGGGYMASGSLEEISLGIVVLHADGTSTDYGTVSRTNFKEQAEAEAEALANSNQDKNILKRISSRLKEIGNG
jgi:DNA-binding IscR family transcriptional regulator